MPKNIVMKRLFVWKCSALVSLGSLSFGALLNISLSARTNLISLLFCPLKQDKQKYYIFNPKPWTKSKVNFPPATGHVNLHTVVTFMDPNSFHRLGYFHDRDIRMCTHRGPRPASVSQPAAELTCLHQTRCQARQLPNRCSVACLFMEFDRR